MTERAATTNEVRAALENIMIESVVRKKKEQITTAPGLRVGR